MRKERWKKNCVTWFWKNTTRVFISLNKLVNSFNWCLNNASGNRMSHCLVLTNTCKIACMKHTQHKNTKTCTAKKNTSTKAFIPSYAQCTVWFMQLLKYIYSGTFQKCSLSFHMVRSESHFNQTPIYKDLEIWNVWRLIRKLLSAHELIHVKTTKVCIRSIQSYWKEDRNFSEGKKSSRFRQHYCRTARGGTRLADGSRFRQTALICSCSQNSSHCPSSCHCCHC